MKFRPSSINQKHNSKFGKEKSSAKQEEKPDVKTCFISNKLPLHIHSSRSVKQHYAYNTFTLEAFMASYSSGPYVGSAS
jgi:hypothetical protein